MDASVNAQDSSGRTPLHLSSQHNHPQISTLLIGTSADVNAVTQDGQTALDLAAAQGYSECVEILTNAIRSSSQETDQETGWGMVSAESTVSKSITAETIKQTINQFSQQWINANTSQPPWTLKHQDQQVSVHSQIPEEEPVVVKAVLTFPDVDLDVLLAVLLNHNNRTEWDSLFSSVRLLATDGPDTHWVYFQLKNGILGRSIV